MIKCRAMKVIVFDNILDEKKHYIVFEKDNELFEGALFFKLDESEEITDILHQEIIEVKNDVELIERCISFYEKYNKKSESLSRTMKHWQFMNSFTGTYMRDTN